MKSNPNHRFEIEQLRLNTASCSNCRKSTPIDSCISVHVTFRREIFCSYTQGEFGDVKLTHEGVLKCVSVADVNLKMFNGVKLTLKDVKHFGFTLCG
ncbi:hypothetical protein QL285_092539 [Trifolium repens]|jgi:hypothetical protein|nr:hypothetical protein QL285_092539 [Trifolium repens]